MLNSSQPSGDLTTDLKAKLVELAKKNRRLQVAVETQKTKIDAFEKPQTGSKRVVELPKTDNEDFKQKFLQSSNKLQEARQETQELRATIQKQKKVLLKELGSQEELDKAFACADDPTCQLWTGRASLITQLQRQLREAKGEENKPVSYSSLASSEPSRRAQQGISAAAHQRRREFDELQARGTVLEEENLQLKKQKEALKCRTQNLDQTVKDLKGHVQVLLEKSDNDDILLSQRHTPEAEAQLMRQAKIIENLQQQLRTGTGADRRPSHSLPSVRRTVPPSPCPLLPLPSVGRTSKADVSSR